jgi:hypothetical protein
MHECLIGFPSVGIRDNNRIDESPHKGSVASENIVAFTIRTIILVSWLSSLNPKPAEFANRVPCCLPGRHALELLMSYIGVSIAPSRRESYRLSPCFVPKKLALARISRASKSHRLSPFAMPSGTTPRPIVGFASHDLRHACDNALTDTKQNQKTLNSLSLVQVKPVRMSKAPKPAHKVHIRSLSGENLNETGRQSTCHLLIGFGESQRCVRNRITSTFSDSIEQTVFPKYSRSTHKKRSELSTIHVNLDKLNDRLIFRWIVPIS